ncbi:TolC family protein [Paraburkholderia terricola]|uniref:Protein CyaE n=1 Tax=Paraburkholderia terricola TaxID=169427 RepID=A0ABU1M287_9BURK|nr:TolC family protein [Paraburkholderia terricola]MDR6412890.1 outer membrane protein [Paraburkholderia terricola]MDR6484751.1 outer membrane protein [Paraburkholderia terricola]
MSKRILVCASALAGFSPHGVLAFDPLMAMRDISGTAAPLPRMSSSCEFGTLGDPLTLREAVERSLCSNPKTREAWANVKEQAAAVGVARAAFLPTVQGNWQGVRDDSLTDVSNHPNLSSETLATVRSESVSLSWTLYDFGARSAALANASALLAALKATQDATLQTTFINVSKDYYAAQAAAGALSAANDVERMAADSMKAAQARVDKGIAPISDALQSQTAHEQAAVSLIKARGALKTAIGTLASDMDLSPNVPLQLPVVNSGAQPDAAFSESIDDLLDAVRRTHPAVLAAQAQLDAALAKVKQTRAEGLPSFSLVSKYSRNNQPASLGLGVPEYPATGHEWYVGFQLTIPFFEGFGRVYKVQQAEAQAEQQRDALNEAQQQAGLDVWTAYQTLETSTDTVRSDAALLDIARRSFSASERRYQVGVGNILELLNAQSALANAEQQHVQALTDWRAARLRLAGSLGRLDFDNVRKQ